MRGFDEASKIGNEAVDKAIEISNDHSKAISDFYERVLENRQEYIYKLEAIIEEHIYSKKSEVDSNEKKK